MKFEISEKESRQAKVPHEVFFTNLVGIISSGLSRRSVLSAHTGSRWSWSR